MDELTKLRENLEICDEVIIDTLRMRYQIVEEITVFKQQHGLSIVHLNEDERKRQFALKKLVNNKYQEDILKVYDYIRYRSKKIQSANVFDYNIFLIGFMGVGKSTISSTLNDIFAMDVIEMDEIIAKRNGMSISEIFEIHGEEYFRNEETKLLIESQSSKNKIISCGGGVPMREENVREMKKNGKIILLTARPETILSRVADSHDRPLIENNKNVNYIGDLMEKRRAKYEAAADVIIQTDGKSAVQICEEIIASAKNQPQ